MKRRDALKASVAAALLQRMEPGLAWTKAATGAAVQTRPRPGTPNWPGEAEWQRLHGETKGRLLKLVSPFASCLVEARNEACAEVLKHLDNPYYVGDQPALTQTSGWQDAWTSQPSAYAVAAAHTVDVVAAVKFAKRHNLRLVVKGGGHSYLGTSNAPDSLLVWTRAMNNVVLHDAFVPQGCPDAPRHAVSIGAGAMWSDAYAAVTTRGGRYVQGGGCTTVGVAGLVQSGGFGSYSKNYGTAAASLLEAEVVTADGIARIANACTNPDLFWAVKGGGGGTFGIVTRVTLRTHELPDFFGSVVGEISASSDAAYRVLITHFFEFYRTSLLNPHWGESVALHGNKLKLSMVFQGLTQAEAQSVWAPFLEWIKARQEYSFSGPKIAALPAQHQWNPKLFLKYAPNVIAMDDREPATADHFVWAGDREQVGWFIHGYHSAWLPAHLLDPGSQTQFIDALLAAAQNWDVGLHFNKGLAGAPKAARDATRNTAMNPQVLDAFALAIISGGGQAAYRGMPSVAPDSTKARARASDIRSAMMELLKVAPNAGAYVSESDYFLTRWQDAYWGSNYARLAEVKKKYDPDGLFFVHHGVGSESWSDDGFTRATS